MCIIKKAPVTVNGTTGAGGEKAVFMAEYRAYINEERVKKGMSWAYIAEKTKLPESTVRKIFSGETLNPSYDAVESIKELFGTPKDPEQREVVEQELQMVKLKDESSTMGTAVRTLNEVYESQIEALKGNLSALKTMYEERIQELKISMHETVAAANNDKKAWQITCIILGIAIAGLVIADFVLVDHGWIRHS